MICLLLLVSSEMRSENKENDAIGRLASGLERGGIQVNKGSWLEKQLHESSFSSGVLNEINSWVNEITQSPEIDAEEQLDNLKERLAPLIGDFKNFKDNFIQTSFLDTDTSK